MNTLRPLTDTDRESIDATVDAYIVADPVTLDGAAADIIIDDDGVRVEPREGGYWYAWTAGDRATRMTLAKVLPADLDSTLLSKMGFTYHS